MYANLLLFQTLSWRGAIPSIKSSRRLIDNEIFLAHWPNYFQMYRNFQGCRNIFSSRWPVFFSGIEKDKTLSHWHNSILGGGIPSTRSSPRLVGNEIFLTHWPNLCSMICNKCILIYSYFRPYLGRWVYPQRKVFVVSLTTRYFRLLDQTIFRCTKIFRAVKIFLLVVD